MPITLGTLTTYQSSANSATAAFTHTCEVGTNLLLLRVSAAGNALPSISATYAGGTLTGVVGGSAQRGIAWTGLFYLKNPPMGTAGTVTIVGGDIEGWVCGAQAIYGSSAAPTNGTASASSLSVTTLSQNGSMVFDVACNNNTTLPASNQTVDYNLSTLGGYGTKGGGSRAAGAGSVVMSYNAGTSAVGCIAACSLSEDIQGAPAGMTPFIAH